MTTPRPSRDARVPEPPPTRLSLAQQLGAAAAPEAQDAVIAGAGAAFDREEAVYWLVDTARCLSPGLVRAVCQRIVNGAHWLGEYAVRYERAGPQGSDGLGRSMTLADLRHYVAEQWTAPGRRHPGAVLDLALLARVVTEHGGMDQATAETLILGSRRRPGLRRATVHALSRWDALRAEDQAVLCGWDALNPQDWARVRTHAVSTPAQWEAAWTALDAWRLADERRAHETALLQHVTAHPVAPGLAVWAERLASSSDPVVLELAVACAERHPGVPVGRVLDQLLRHASDAVVARALAGMSATTVGRLTVTERALVLARGGRETRVALVARLGASDRPARALMRR